MKNEENFLNALKDYWVGREYKYKSSLGDAVIEILNDYGDEVEFRVKWIKVNDNKMPSASAATSTTKKKELKNHIINAGYVRVK